MKRDWNLIETILTKVEKGHLLSWVGNEEYKKHSVVEDDLLGHIEILLDAGLLKNGIVKRGGDGEICQYDLRGIYISMQGHDILDALRDKPVWDRIKSKAQKAAVSISWEFIKAAIPVVMREILD
ncbi:MAG: DUF2513 domain-containing protein [Lachnospiraceae bacterium]|nr:DUF2513 domain-containing protein [Lachnospiraceae bacterium]